MPKPSLQERIDAAREAADPFAALYEIAQSLRDVGLPQYEIYRLFCFFRAEQDEPFSDEIADVLDCIWSGGWGKRSEDLFESALTSQQVNVVWIELDEPESDSDGWQLSIEHPNLYLHFQIEGPEVIAELLQFVRSNIGQGESTELKIGSIGEATVSIVKDEEYDDRLFFVVLSEAGSVRHTLHINDIGDFLRGLTDAAESLAEDQDENA